MTRRPPILPLRPDPTLNPGGLVSDHVYKQIELTGSSTDSIDDAIRTAVAKASETIHNMRWFEVTDMRGHIEGGAVAHFQVTVKIGFTVD
jgi:dodecin